MELQELPGAELILPGLDDLLHGKNDTIGSLLIAIASVRLAKAGLDIPQVPLAREPELTLYAHLQNERFSDAYPYYNALLNSLNSFCAALELNYRYNDHGKGFDNIDITQYEGVYTEVTMPGYHVILQRSSNGHNLPRTEVIKIPVLELEEETLICKYEILKDDITEAMAQSLIKYVLLDEFCDNYYKNKANIIDFINLNLNTHHQIVYK